MAVDGHSEHRAEVTTLLPLGTSWLQILRECFLSPRARTAMIATISPSFQSWEQTLNTVRYADRLKGISERQGHRRGSSFMSPSSHRQGSLGDASPHAFTFDGIDGCSSVSSGDAELDSPIRGHVSPLTSPQVCPCSMQRASLLASRSAHAIARCRRRLVVC